MNAEAIEKIRSISQPVIVTVDQDRFSTIPLKRIPKELNADPLEVSTLSSLVQYILQFKETYKPIPLLVHIVSHTRVELITALDRDRNRETLIVAKADTPRIPFDTFIDNEKMLIAVQSMFIDDPDTDRAAVLKFAGTVTNGSIKEYGDDGITQKATIKQGVASKAEAIVPSPCRLRPFRTFIEVRQPESQFIFRMRERGNDQIESALYEADGGAWKLEAKENIKNYLSIQLKDADVTIIA